MEPRPVPAAAHQVSEAPSSSEILSKLTPYARLSVALAKRPSAALLVAAGAVVLTVCLGEAVGGLVGFFAGTDAMRFQDLKFGLGGLALAAIAGVLFVVRSRRRGAALLPRFVRLPVPVLVLLAVLCAALTVPAFIDGPSKSPSTSHVPVTSAMASDLMLVVFFAQWAVIFGLAAVRRRSVADQAVAGDQGEVQGGQ
jgi:hypothetical protein